MLRLQISKFEYAILNMHILLRYSCILNHNHGLERTAPQTKIAHGLRIINFQITKTFLKR